MRKASLFCFPFAGGSKYSYNHYLKSSDPNLKIIPYDYPGRGARLRESLLTNLDEIVHDAFIQIKHDLNTPYAIFGHSMGALVAFLLTKTIIKNNYPKPFELFLTGSRGPACVRKESTRYSLPNELFVKKLKEIGGCPEEVLNDDELMRFFEPILRADFKALETHQYTTKEMIDVPITVMIGKDEKISYEEVKMWRNETTKEVQIVQFSGKHFFIFEHADDIMKLILGRVNAHIPLSIA
jgi:surfactin synthase thioesterase subunit